MLHKARCIVVMAGSFNPPTIAHLCLMESAVQAARADRGIFVPAGEAYLKRKMRKSGDRIRFDERTRMDMLRAMCVGREHLLVCDLQIQRPMIRTYDTLSVLQDKYPSAKLYLIAGADKLTLLETLAVHTDFMERFGVVLFSREGVNAKAAVEQNAYIAPFGRSFIYAEQVENMEEVSSTAVRRLIAEGEAEGTRPYLHEEVWKRVRHVRLEDFPIEIEGFQGAYAFLSNSFESSFTYKGLSFVCAESAFQAARCVHAADRERIAQASGANAKRIAAGLEQREDWEIHRLSAMEEILRAKFMQNPELAMKLADTANAVLIHRDKDKACFWGKDLYTGFGENHLGLLLMKLRTEIQNDMKRGIR